MDKNDKILALERHRRIVEMARRQEMVKVDELTDFFNVSEVTIRHDLGVLAKEGLIIRKHGGAIINSRTDLALAFEQRVGLNMETKRAIGITAAQFVKPGDTILIDAGTTNLEFAKNIPEISPLTVVTNALNVATQAGTLHDANVILLGGLLSRRTVSTIGPNTVRELEDMVVSKLFLGIHAVDPETGLTDVSLEIAQTKRAMIKAAKQVILLADSSKWGKSACVKIMPLSAVQVVISDSNLSEETQDAIKDRGIELLLV